MAIDPAKRMARWNLKYDTERIKSTLDALRPDMYTHVQATFPEVAAMEIEVKQYLDTQGVQSILYPQYLNFGREIFALRRKGFSGTSMQEIVAVLLAKWVARGLTLAVLEGIRTEVFDVSAPSGP